MSRTEYESPASRSISRTIESWDAADQMLIRDWASMSVDQQEAAKDSIRILHEALGRILKSGPVK